MKTIRTELSQQDIVNNMLELVAYLAKQEDDANTIDITVNNNGKSLHMHFSAYIEDCEEDKE